MLPHGSSKPSDPTDPMELAVTVVPGEVRYLARCLVEEYAQIGYGADALFLLFRQPGYPMMNRLFEVEGESSIRKMIEEVLAECGTFRISAQEQRCGREDERSLC